MGSYRSRLDIIADMLRVVVENDGERAKKTEIMYRANLSYKLLKKYLDEVLEAQLLLLDGEEKVYFLTVKGRRFLEKYDRYSRRNELLERQLDELNHRREALEELSLTG